tara:strand:- start:6828 stop:7349 length:522 start_codon:yes stop_codon:yes gene_type:complete
MDFNWGVKDWLSSGVENFSKGWDKTKGMINDVRNRNEPSNLVGMPPGSQEAFQASSDTQSQNNTAYSSNEPWSDEEENEWNMDDGGDQTLRDYNAMSPSQQRRQIRENKFKGRFQAFEQKHPGAAKVVGAGGMLGQAMSNMKAPKAYEYKMMGRQPQRPQGLLGTQYSDSIQY